MAVQHEANGQDRLRTRTLGRVSAKLGRSLAWLGCLGCLACQQRVLLGYEEDASGAIDAGNPPEPGDAATDGAVPPQPPELPEPGELLWSADVETGDLTQWTSDGQGYNYEAAQASIVASTAHSLSGDFALEATIDAIGDVLPQAVMFRSGDLQEAFYTAWYCLREDYDASFWVIMNFEGDRPFMGATTDDRFDIDLSRSPADDRLHLELDEFGGSSTLSPIPIPIGEWFQLEVYYKSSPNDDGRLVAWQDGELVFDTGERPTAPSSFVGFGVGVAAWRVAPLPATLWIDDVQIRAVQ